jgi:transposase InsO family protein
VTSWGGALYLLTLTDECTGKTFGYFLTSKVEVKARFEGFQLLVENQTVKKIKILRTDNGKEYVNKAFQYCLKMKGIRHQTTVPYTPQQNEVAERVNRLLLRRLGVCCRMQDLARGTGLEAVNTAIYLKNRWPTSAVKHVTPEEAWAEETVNSSHRKYLVAKLSCMFLRRIAKSRIPRAKNIYFLDTVRRQRAIASLIQKFHEGDEGKGCDVFF